MAEEGSGKVNACPRAFFNFGGRGSSMGGNLPISDGRPAYPFTSTFRFDTWFRAEAFEKDERIIIVNFKTTGGAGVTVELRPNQEKAEDPTATLLVKVSHDDSKMQETTTVLEGCVLFPREWYFLTVKHCRVKSFFASR